MFIPDGFAQVVPYIFATNANQYMDHLLAALGGVDIGRTMRGDVLANGQVRFGDAGIMISEASDAFPPSQSSFYLYVKNADKAMARALKHAMTSVMDVGDMDYGDRQGGVKDKAGNIWWLSQRLIDAPYRHFYSVRTSSLKRNSALAGEAVCLTHCVRYSSSPISPSERITIQMFQRTNTASKNMVMNCTNVIMPTKWGGVCACTIGSL